MCGSVRVNAPYSIRHCAVSRRRQAEFHCPFSENTSHSIHRRRRPLPWTVVLAVNCRYKNKIDIIKTIIGKSSNYFRAPSSCTLCWRSATDPISCRFGCGNPFRLGWSRIVRADTNRPWKSNRRPSRTTAIGRRSLSRTDSHFRSRSAGAGPDALSWNALRPTAGSGPGRSRLRAADTDSGPPYAYRNTPRSCRRAAVECTLSASACSCHGSRRPPVSRECSARNRRSPGRCDAIESIYTNNCPALGISLGPAVSVAHRNCSRVFATLDRSTEHVVWSIRCRRTENQIKHKIYIYREIVRTIVW